MKYDVAYESLGLCVFFSGRKLQSKSSFKIQVNDLAKHNSIEIWSNMIDLSFNEYW